MNLLLSSWNVSYSACSVNLVSNDWPPITGLGFIISHWLKPNNDSLSAMNKSKKMIHYQPWTKAKQWFITSTATINVRLQHHLSQVCDTKLIVTIRNDRQSRVCPICEPHKICLFVIYFCYKDKMVIDNWVSLIFAWQMTCESHQCVIHRMVTMISILVSIS